MFLRQQALHLLLVILFTILPLQLPAHAQVSILGFTTQSTARENEIEQKFKAIPDAKEERRQHRIFTAEPHLAGSKRNNELARYVANEWRKQGLDDVVIRRYDVYSTEPRSTSLEMISPIHYRAGLRELPNIADSDTRNRRVSSAWLRLANADLLPFDFGSYSDNIQQFVEDLRRENSKKDTSQADLAALSDHIRRFGIAGRQLDQSISQALATGALNPSTTDSLNHGMTQV